MAAAQARRNILPFLVCAQFIITFDTTFYALVLAAFTIGSAKFDDTMQLAAATITLSILQQQGLLATNEYVRERSLTIAYYALRIIGLLGLTAAYFLPHAAPLAAPARTTARRKTKERRHAAAYA